MTSLLTALALIASAAAPSASPDAPSASPVTVREQAPGYYRMKLGDFEVTALLDGTVMLPTDKVMLGIERDELDRLLKAGFRSIPTEISINAYLVNTGSHLILVDTGAGSFFGPRGGGRLLANLRASGYRPEDVDAVLITHMHGDHLAGLIADGTMAFPQATIWAERHELAFWTGPASEMRVPADWREWFKRAADILKLYGDAGRLKPFDGAGPLLPGVRAEPAFGHTPGHSLYVFESRGERLTIAGDVAHLAEVQLHHPQAHIAFDFDPSAAIALRQHFLADAAANRSLVAMSHLAFPGIGHVRLTGTDKYEWVPIPYSIAGLQHRHDGKPSGQESLE